MPLEDWIDEVAKKAGQVSDGRGGFVRAYAVFGKDEWPANLTVFPAALTFTENVVVRNPESGPNVDSWIGIIEFHLVPGTSRKDYPYIMRFFNRIRAAFAADKTLGGLVQYCKLTEEGPSIEGPIVFDPDTGDANLGLVAHWVARERYS
jgi:hypothetical protein